jgi:uncharacterized protein DUF3309
MVRSEHPNAAETLAVSTYDQNRLRRAVRVEANRYAHGGLLGCARTDATFMRATLAIIVLSTMLVGVLPRWDRHRKSDYFPSAAIGFAMVIVVVLGLLGRL